MESQGALAASLFIGFPHADIPDTGTTAVIVTDGDKALAETYRDEIAGMAWAGRRDFVYKLEPLADSLARARRMTEGPVVLLDHYDNAASGGTMDTTTVLGGILDAGFEDVAAFAIFDPASVQQMVAAGIGSTVTLDLGGKMAMPALGLKGHPRRVTGTVRTITDGRYRNKGPMMKGVLFEMGPTAVLDTGKVQIVVVSNHIEPNDVACLESVGIDPTKKRYLMIKSRVHFRAGFAPIAKEIVECAGTGVCTSDYSMLRFRKVRRPIFPLDDGAVAP
jgi:microcystin degradation protein MlrC